MVYQCILGLKDHKHVDVTMKHGFVFSTINMWVYKLWKKVIYCIYSNSCYHEKRKDLSSEHWDLTWSNKRSTQFLCFTKTRVSAAHIGI